MSDWTTELANIIKQRAGLRDMIKRSATQTPMTTVPHPDVSQMQGGGWPQMKRDVTSGLSMVKGVLVGNPEDVADSTKSWWGNAAIPHPILEGSQINVPVPGERTYGTIDAGLAALPFIGGTMRQGTKFFSQLMKTLETKLPARATAEHVLNVARKGAKADELRWSGLEDMLMKDPKRVVTREEVLEHARTNAPEIREKMITEKPVGRTTGDRIRAGLDTSRPKFTTYTLPGGENHRELVVTMPGKNPIKARTETPLDFDEWADQYGIRLDGEEDIQNAENMYQRYLNDDTANEFGENQGIGNYNVPAGHAYGDPELDVNRLFHARMNDRDGGKTLFLEELQSDWHQAGRKEGYAVKGYEPLTEAENKEWAKLYNTELEDMTQVQASRFDELQTRRVRSEGIGGVSPTTGVPDAPFKNTWHELGFRRMLQEAADGGYERLAWTTGAQQADRYALSKHVDRLRYDPVTQSLTGYKGRSLGPIFEERVAPDKLADYIGAEPAKKLLETSAKKKFQVKPYNGLTLENNYDTLKDAVAATTHPRDKIIEIGGNHELSGVDLDLGGEGMSGFYDLEILGPDGKPKLDKNGKPVVGMIPAYAEKIGKKYGVKVEKHILSGTMDAKQVEHDLRIMANDTGVDRGTTYLLHRIADRVRDSKGSKSVFEIAQEIKSLPADTFKRYGVTNESFSNVSKRLPFIKTSKGEETWSLPITDKMRADLKDNGQALYATPPVVRLPGDKKKEEKPHVGIGNFMRDGKLR